MDFETINLSVRDGIARIAINRPKVLNALNRQVITELDKAASKVRLAEDIRVLIITGEGGNFAAGADISEMVDLDQMSAAEFSFNPTFNDIEALPIPVIAAVDGYALGGGLELALACDIRLCSSKAKFGLPEIRIGIFPGAGGTQRLPRIIGHGRARELIYTGRQVDAQTAEAWGLCNFVVDENLEEEAFKLAKRIASGPPLALKVAKAAIRAGAEKGIVDGVVQEAIYWNYLFSTKDQKEGMKAFLEKRKPHFCGE